jgi:hypothetical protein
MQGTIQMRQNVFDSHHMNNTDDSEVQLRAFPQ